MKKSLQHVQQNFVVREWVQRKTCWPPVFPSALLRGNLDDWGFRLRLLYVYRVHRFVSEHYTGPCDERMHSRYFDLHLKFHFAQLVTSFTCFCGLGNAGIGLQIPTNRYWWSGAGDTQPLVESSASIYWALGRWPSASEYTLSTTVIYHLTNLQHLYNVWLPISSHPSWKRARNWIAQHQKHRTHAQVPLVYVSFGADVYVRLLNCSKIMTVLRKLRYPT
jgi:hypothetical protein